jgi:hypothetical protein
VTACFGQFFENYTISPHFGATFFLSIDYVLISAKMGWATFWAIFSQTYLVTLLGDHSLVPFFSSAPDFRFFH